jgi:hypothetical protein
MEEIKMMNKYWVFRKLIDFVADYCEVTDADMNNYAGDIEIKGKDEEDGSTITIKVSIKEGENNGESV